MVKKGKEDSRSQAKAAETRLRQEAAARKRVLRALDQIYERQKGKPSLQPFPTALADSVPGRAVLQRKERVLRFRYGRTLPSTTLILGSESRSRSRTSTDCPQWLYVMDGEISIGGDSLLT